jgi:hypothetical protein
VEESKRQISGWRQERVRRTSRGGTKEMMWRRSSGGRKSSMGEERRVKVKRGE